MGLVEISPSFPCRSGRQPPPGPTRGINPWERQDEAAGKAAERMSLGMPHSEEETPSQEEMVLVTLVAGLGELVSSFPKVTKRSCQHLTFANRRAGCVTKGSAPAFPGAAWFPRL